MAKMFFNEDSIKAGSTSVSISVEVLNAADDLGKTGVVYGDVTAYYWRQGGTPTSISVVALTNIDDAYSSGGWKETDSTNMPGIYRLDIPDAAFAISADWVIISLKIASAKTKNYRFVLNVLAVDSSGFVTLTDASLTSAKFGAGAITAAAIAADAIQAAKIQDNAITANKIASSAISSTKIATGAITSAAFAAGAITSTAIAASAIGATQIAGDAITSDKIADDAIGAEHIADDAIGVAQLTAGALDADVMTTALINAIADGLFARTLSTESYAAAGATPTFGQWCWAMLQRNFEFAVVGTTLTVYAKDGSTPVMTFTLDSATAPTSLHRAS